MAIQGVQATSDGVERLHDSRPSHEVVEAARQQSADQHTYKSKDRRQHPLRGLATVVLSSAGDCDDVDGVALAAEPA